MFTKARLRTLLSLAISAGLLAYLYREYFSDAQELQIRWGWIVAGVALSLTLNFGLGAYKWSCVLRLHGIQLARWDLIRIWVGIFPLGIVFPFQTGHLLFAKAVQTKARVSFGLSFRAMVFDKSLNVLATLLLVALGQLLLPADHPMSHPLILIGAVTPLGAFLFLNLQDIANRLPSSWKKLRLWLAGMNLELGFGVKLKLLFLAGLYQSTDVLSALFAGFAIRPRLNVAGLLGVFPIVVLASYVPAAFAGLGAREAFSVLWLSSSLSQAEAASVGFLVSVMEYAAPAVFGLGCVAFTISAVTASSQKDAIEVNEH